MQHGDQARSVMDNVLRAKNTLTGSYLTILQRMNVLRQICNLGLAAPSSSAQSEELDEGSWNSAQAQDAFDALAGLGQALCSICSLDVSVSNSDGIGTEDHDQFYISKCIRAFGGNCFRKHQSPDSSSTPSCRHDPTCPVAAVNRTHTIDDTALSIMDSGNNSEVLPTKMEALTREIESSRDMKR